MKRISFFLLMILSTLLLTACSAENIPEVALMPLVQQQMELGPRVPGSDAHKAFIEQTVSLLQNSGWTVRSEAEQYQGKTVWNIIAEKGADNTDGKWIVIGAHFDSRILADQEKSTSGRQQPVPAANDGASGVAVLLGLAKTLGDPGNKRITLAFFDAEDQGKIMGWPDFCLGSALLAEQYGQAEKKPDAVIIADNPSTARRS